MGVIVAGAPIKPRFEISHIVNYAGGISAPQINLLRNQLCFLNQPQQPAQGLVHLPCTGLLLILSSFGGGTFDMRSIYGLLRALSYPIEIHAVGSIKSAAVPLMLATDYRTAAPDTTFLFHPWTWGTDAHPGHTAEGLLNFPVQLDDDMTWGRQVFRERSKLTDDEINKMELFAKPQIKDAQFALKYGLVHEVVERKIPPGVMTWNIA